MVGSTIPQVSILVLYKELGAHEPKQARNRAREQVDRENSTP